MAQQTIDIGAAPNDGTGDTLRAAGEKINENFTELYEIDDAGVFTPELLFGGANVGMTYASRSGRYRKFSSLGLVLVQVNLTLSARGSSTGNATIGGLPFAASVGPNNMGSIMCSGTVGIVVPQCAVGSGASTVALLDFEANSISLLTNGNFANASEIYLSVLYATT
jgi:hypothetical protein